ncbi:MAG: gliding motility-associated C-terminal domain-containing protein, partial [Bacteroidota bacterium]
EIFFINLSNGNYNVGRVSVVNSDGFQIDAIVFDPQYGSCFGFDRLQKKMVVISWQTGFITNFGFQKLDNVNTIASMFYTLDGRLFGWARMKNEGSERTLVEINRNNGSIQEVDTGLGAMMTDGASCGLSIEFEKISRPQRALPCGEVRFVYRFLNRAGTAIFGLEINDTLPEVFTIKSIERNPYSGTLNSGPGSNIFSFSMIDFTLGLDSIVIVADIDPLAAGPYESQADFGRLYGGLGDVLLSDDPNRRNDLDPTRTIVDANASVRGLQEKHLCFGDSLILMAPYGDVSYKWSNGSRDSAIIITEGGLYQVEVETPCAVFIDSFQVDAQSFPINVNLGPDIEISTGTEVFPTFTTNASNPSFVWTASDSTPLSCTQCPNPASRPLKNTLYTLTVTDENGCVGSDEWLVEVVDAGTMFYAATAFSPNDDGVNDEFFLMGQLAAEIRSFRIFNRWGKVVHAAQGRINDASHGWNGYTNGLPQAEGVYAWAAEIVFPDGSVRVEQGSLTLLR